MTGLAEISPIFWWVTAIVTFVTAVAAAWRTWGHPLYKRARGATHALGDFLDDWNGEPEVPARPGHPGRPARPGVLARLDHQRDHLNGMEARLRVIEHEVTPNNGSSMSDEVSRIARRLERLETNLDTSK